MSMVFDGQGELVAAIYLVPLLIAALWDMRYFRIPNQVVIASAAAFVPAWVMALGPVDPVAHLSAAAIMFAFGVVMFRFRLLGGGDVKLLTVVALWVGLGHLIPYFIVVSILGGVTWFALVACRRLIRRAAPRLKTASDTSLPAIFREGERIPYALPIAAASLLMLPVLPFLSF